MECPNCKQTTSGIIEDNRLWCDKCGTSIREDTQFVPSYNTRYAPSQQIYSRVKRFTKYLQRLKIPLVLANVYAIQDLYSSFEFTWGCNREKSKRIYFYAKPVILNFICKLLYIETELPCLKDHLREIDQYQELAILTNTTAFEISTANKFKDSKALLVNDSETTTNI